MISVFR